MESEATNDPSVVVDVDQCYDAPGQMNRVCAQLPMNSSKTERPRRARVGMRDVHHCATCGSRYLSLCATVPAEQLEQLNTYARPFMLAEGSALFDQGDVPRYIYTVIAGCMRLSMDLADGRRQVIGFPMPGDYFGLTSLPRYDYAAVALMPSRLCKISLEGFHELIEEVRPIDDRIRIRSEQMLCAARSHIMTLGRRNALERVAGFILECLEHPSHVLTPMTVSEGNPARSSLPETESQVVSLPMTRGDIADYLGLTVETVSRSLSRLRRSGMVELLDGVGLRVCNRAALVSLAGSG